MLYQSVKRHSASIRIIKFFTLIIGLTMSASTLNASGTTERSGGKVFNSFCVACHLHGVAGAPKLGNSADWLPRKEKGMPTLLKHAIEGLNAMPPKGMCSNCSDDEIQAAIQFMLDNS
ncbi:cbb3-type cytochrome c oxidase subunit III [Marinomonas aquiplantarum]|uniref:Cbb3-type cytochrome c oxidase subunit III n=2 Tax=Marinomonas aquiplantarum TaxID=491951 RepID=A0A366CWD3_9GAMM|nr:cbb3-type cytochrome c oxidase subunit III [Marinomonas aquiplantarum]